MQLQDWCSVALTLCTVCTFQAVTDSRVYMPVSSRCAACVLVVVSKP